MKPEDIKLSDWSRMLLGEVPPEFYFELAIRAVIVYILLHVCMRMLGKRMASQMSISELTAMVALASAIGVPMLSFDRGLLPSVIIAFTIVGITRLIANLNFRSEQFEQLAEGNVELLVEDSRLNLEAMKRTRVPRERLFAHLRSENILHLGAVKRIYMEANGSFTMVENDKKRPGLSVLPEWDDDFIRERVIPTNTAVCKSCGNESPHAQATAKIQAVCPNCNAKEWIAAVIEKSETD